MKLSEKTVSRCVRGMFGVGKSDRI